MTKPNVPSLPQIKNEAREVYNETLLTPRELLAQRDELHEALKLLTDNIEAWINGAPAKGPDESKELYEKAKAALAKVEGE